MSRYLETIKVCDGEVYHLEYHQKRLDFVMQKYNSTYDLQALLSPPKKGFYRCRIVYDENSLHVEYLPYKKRIIKRLRLVYDDRVEYAKKYRNRDVLRSLYALKDECDEVIIVKNRYLTDTTIANIALYDGDAWYTPKTPLLRGTTRERLLDEGVIHEKNIRVEDIMKYKKLALMNAMIDFDIIASDKLKDIIC